MNTAHNIDIVCRSNRKIYHQGLIRSILLPLLQKGMAEYAYPAHPLFWILLYQFFNE
jgi:hypothetical protein